MAKSNSQEYDQLQQLRAHYVTQIERIDSALAIMQESRKLAARAGLIIGKVRKRADADPINGHETASTFVGKSGRPVALASAIQKAKKAKGERPIDVLRKVFIAAEGAKLTRDDLLKLSHFERDGVGVGMENQPPAGRASRALGIILSRLVGNKEIREGRDGYVATAALAKAAAAE